ncbi:hypothetical protein EA473_02150 [Natrarchaeobius chitinivorans]|uniref:Uncharacterized protein n=1 Tax=Natrarchaeobius chitinivorans TaxID=1679083 RepID=A0A3N6M3G9_NATCH|nr:hypothetical protein EA473_02150 [Natrarchaeobius chitinivorans]
MRGDNSPIGKKVRPRRRHSGTANRSGTRFEDDDESVRHPFRRRECNEIGWHRLERTNALIRRFEVAFHAVTVSKAG